MLRQALRGPNDDNWGAEHLSKDLKRIPSRRVYNSVSCDPTNQYPAWSNAHSTCAPLPVLNTIIPSPHLFVSNSPEEITTAVVDLNQNLYLARMLLPAPLSTKLRVFIWHLNTSGDDVTIRLAASLSAGTAKLSGRVQQVTSNGNGLCLAYTQLYRTFDPPSPHELVDHRRGRR